MQRWWTVPLCVGLWLAGCSLFEFPAPERAEEATGGTNAGGSSGASAGTPTTGGEGGTDLGGQGGSTSGAAGDGGSAGSATGGNAGSVTGGSAGSATGGSATGGAGGDAGSSGQGPTLPVTDDLRLWLDANDVAGDGPAIAIWANRAESTEPDATQPAELQRPLVTTVGGRNGVAFDGSRFMSFGEGFEDFSRGLTFFVVARFEALEACRELLQFSNGKEIDDISFQADLQGGTVPGVFLFEVGLSNMTTAPGVLAGNSPMLVSVAVTPPGGATSIVANTIPAAMQTEAGFVPVVARRRQNYLGSGLYDNCEPFAGVLFELLLYNRALTPEDIELVNGYLQEKWTCCAG